MEEISPKNTPERPEEDSMATEETRDTTRIGFGDSKVEKFREEVKKEKLDNSTSMPLLKHIARIMYAAGDCKTPLRASVELLHRFLSEILNILFKPIVLKEVIRWQNPVISKKVKFKKMLKYLERVFSVETTIYFSSMEIKKYIGSQKGGENNNNSSTTRKRLASTAKGRRLYLNPVSEMEQNLRLRKYDKFRKIHMERKIEKGKFNSKRTQTMTDDEMKEFEHCKEERLYTEKRHNMFVQFVEVCCKTNFDFLSNKKIFFDFLSYILSRQIKQCVRESLRTLSGSGVLEEQEAPLTVEQLSGQVGQLKAKISKLQNYLLKKASNRIETLAYHQFKKESEKYLDMLLGTDEYLLKHKIVRVSQNKYEFGSILLRDKHRADLAKDMLIMELIENPKLLWKHLLAKVKNAWMERIIVRKRLFSRLKEIRDSVSFEVLGAGDGVNEAEGDASERRSTVIYKKLADFLKKSARKKSFEFYVRRALLASIDPKEPVEVFFDRKGFKDVVKNCFREYFVREIYSPGLDSRASFEALAGASGHQGGLFDHSGQARRLGEGAGANLSDFGQQNGESRAVEGLGGVVSRSKPMENKEVSLDSMIISNGDFKLNSGKKATGKKKGSARKRLRTLDD